MTDKQVFEGVIEYDNSGNGSYYSWHKLVQDDGEALELIHMTDKLEGKRVRITVEVLNSEQEQRNNNNQKIYK